jgi:hypothetical protein
MWEVMEKEGVSKMVILGSTLQRADRVPHAQNRRMVCMENAAF